MDYKLINGKLSLLGGDIQLTSDYFDSVAQRLYIRLKSNYGKWFLDTSYGVDYYGKIFGKVRNKTRVDLLLKDEILKEENVVRITKFRSTIDTQTRNYSCDFTVKLVGISVETRYRIITTQNGFALLTQNDKYITTP